LFETEILWGSENKEHSWLRGSWDSLLQNLGGRQPQKVVEEKERL
jgi:hypothetical protein